ncbi:glycosyltransferase [Cryobacterium sp. TMT4-31]|uniref:glycosyltransferase n=1 Tax=Cryobacterium sp. TMT4-31 TaxID=1259259 RepID=UPI00106DA957|nr:glycosyltransferase [Cryobacterium sp. TMT4-31]TFC89883.1 glycosyltransferase [Cryobacterium sp. TMT4-31]
MGNKSLAIIGTRGYPSYYGGFETAVRKLAPFLTDAGWDVTVYGRPGATRDSDPSLDERVIRRVTRGVESKSLSTLSYGLSASIDAAVRKPDVALVMNVANGYFLPLLKARGIPTVVNVDGIEWDRQKWGRLAKKVFRNGARLTARHATELVVDAREIGHRWEADFGRGGVFIPYGGDSTNPLPLEPGLTHRGYILVVARFVPENTIGEFIESARILSERWPVVIVGSSGYGGPLEEAVGALVRDHPAVRWLGHVSDDKRLLSLWQHAGVYFHGHSVGGTNPALVQAMAAGAPVVARDTVYNREVLGNAGATCAPNSAAITLALQRFLSEDVDREAQSRLSVERARSNYSWLSVCQAYDGILTAAAVGTPRASVLADRSH